MSLQSMEYTEFKHYQKFKTRNNLQWGCVCCNLWLHKTAKYGNYYLGNKDNYNGEENINKNKNIKLLNTTWMSKEIFDWNQI